MTGPTFDLRGLITGLALGTVGGYICFKLHVPLAFMIGAMIATTAASMGGVRVAIPPMLRNNLVIVLGIMLGSAFSPALLEKLGEWSVSLLGLVAYILVASWVGFVYLRRVAGYDRVTGYFTAMPGGFNEMVILGGALGGDDRTIALGHSLRIMLVVLTVPVAFQAMPGYDPAGRDWSLRGLGPGMTEVAWVDYAIMALCFVGAPLAQKLRIPAGILVGPMLLSAGLHLSGVTDAKPPGLLVAIAQIVLGVGIGSRFARVPVSFVLHKAKIAVGLTLLLVIMTLILAISVHWLTGLSLAALVLAYAPGGLAEMSLVALALHVDAAFVATHHIARIIMVILFAPVAFHLWQRWAGPEPKVPDRPLT